MKYIKNLEQRLAERFNVEYHTDGEDIPEVWKEYPLCYLGYGSDRESCVREGSIFWHDEVLLGVIDMFYDYYTSLARMLEKKHKLGEETNVTVMPSYEDRTYVVVTYKKKVLLEGDCKAWNFCWENPTDLNERLGDDSEEMENNL